MKLTHSFVDKYRLNLVKQSIGSNLNWIFLPGGPGMGSEYLADFVKELQLPGSLYLVDFPGDGSNRNCEHVALDEWKMGLVNIVKQLHPCIVVTHSFSGMITLSVPELEDAAAGLVLLNSCPDNNYQSELVTTAKTYNLPNVSNEHILLVKEQIDHNLRLLFDACIPYMFLSKEIEQAKVLVDKCNFNPMTYLWADTVFKPTYQHTWTPQKLSTLIIGSSEDMLLPIKLFQNNPEFIRSNIDIVELPNTSHFLWLSKFSELQQVLLNWLELNVQSDV